MERLGAKLAEVQALATELGFVGEAYRGRNAYWILLDGETEPEFLGQSHADALARLRVMDRCRTEARYRSFAQASWPEYEPQTDYVI